MESLTQIWLWCGKNIISHIWECPTVLSKCISQIQIQSIHDKHCERECCCLPNMQAFKFLNWTCPNEYVGPGTLARKKYYSQNLLMQMAYETLRQHWKHVIWLAMWHTAVWCLLFTKTILCVCSQYGGKLKHNLQGIASKAAISCNSYKIAICQ